jgi:hypothetical protein
MSEVSDKELQDLYEAAFKVANQFNVFEKSLLQLENSVKAGKKTFDLDKSQSVIRNRVQKGVTEELSRYMNAVKEGNADFSEVSAALQHLREQALAAAAGDEKLQEIIKRDFAQKETLLKFQSAYSQTLGKAVGVASTVVGGLVASYQNSTSGLEAALNNAKVGLDLLVLGAKGVAGLFKGIPVVGEGIKAAADAVSESAQKLMPILNAEVKKVADAFKNASNAGLLFSDGISGLKNAAISAGLPMGVFADAIKQNSEAVSIFGGNVTAGAKRIGQVTKLIDTASLQKLGYNLEEIPGLIAQTGARLRRSGVTGDAEVARATMDYAKNLRVIADLTGKDAKTLMDKQDVAEQDLAYQLYLADKTPEEANAIRQQMMALPESVQAMAREMMVSGGNLTSDVTNLTAQQVPAYKAMADAAYAAANSGTASGQMGLKILQDNAAAAEAQTKSIIDFAVAASVLNDGLRPVADGIAADRALLLRALDPTKIEEMMRNVENAGKTKDPDTVKLAELERIGMANQVRMQDAVVESLGSYMAVLVQLNKVTELAVKGFSATVKAIVPAEQTEEKSEVNGSDSAASRRTNLSQTFNSTNDASSGVAAAALSQQRNIDTKDLASFATMISGTPGGLDPDHDAPPDALAWLQAHPDDPRTKEFLARTGAQLARGGIVSGPTSGFLATLHGTEAVLPPNLTEMLLDVANKPTNSQTDTVAMLETFTNRANSGSSNNDSLLEMLIGKVDELISATKIVADHTELTAQRIA